MTVTRTSKLCTQKMEGKSRDKLHGLNVKDYMITFVHQDLFLLENQLPFGVLKLIFEEVEFNIDEGSTSEIQLEDPSHLLDLLRSGFCCPRKKGKQQGNRLSF
ncbi:hypothetical protein AAG906_006248 [Vitis piasezkii]